MQVSITAASSMGASSMGRALTPARSAASIMEAGHGIIPPVGTRALVVTSMAEDFVLAVVAVDSTKEELAAGADSMAEGVAAASMAEVAEATDSSGQFWIRTN
jgi:hypothetical protein